MRATDFHLRTKTQAGQVQMEGDYTYRGIRFKFTLNELPKGDEQEGKLPRKKYRGRIKDITWPTENPSFAVCAFDRPDVMCAIHNYGRPLLPITALVLFARHEALGNQFPEEELRELFVVSTNSSLQADAAQRTRAGIQTAPASDGYRSKQATPGKRVAH